MSELLRTPLYDAHVALGATMVDFGGWEMPIQYPAGIVGEHLATRKKCGIFDVSHMGRLVVTGPQRLEFVQKVLSNNAAALTPGRAQYSIIPNAAGGAVDDAYVYRWEEDSLFIIVNASNREKDLAHFAPWLQELDCTLTDLTFTTASIALQGPDSEAVLKKLTGAEFICDGKKNALNILQAEGRRLGLSRTGYTGEPIGFELFVKAEEAAWLWQRLQELGAEPIGLGARDTLRLEAGLPLYGHEMGLDPYGVDIPIFAVSLARFGVSFAEEKGEFVGRDALLAQKEGGTDRRLVAIRLTDRGVIRAGMEVYRGDARLGYITSGTMVPYFAFEGDAPTQTTGKRSIGFALLSDAQVGDTVEVDVRGRRLKAEVVAKHLIQNQPPYARPVL